MHTVACSGIFSEAPDRNVSYIFGCVWGGKNDGHIFNCLPLKGFDDKRKMIGLKIYFNAKNCSRFVTTEGCLLGKPFFPIHSVQRGSEIYDKICLVTQNNESLDLACYKHCKQGVKVGYIHAFHRVKVGPNP